MAQQIINEIVPVIITAVIAILVAVIKGVGDACIQYIQKKRNALEVKIGKDEFDKKLAFAKEAWNIVDEYFRITPQATKTIEAAQGKFMEEIKKLVPNITDDEVAELRQAIAGEVNKGREALTSETLAAKSSTAKAEQDSAENKLKAVMESVQAAQKAVNEAASKVNASTNTAV